MYQTPGIDTLAWKRYQIEGYASKTSVIQGDNIDFMVDNGDSSLVGAQYQMRIYRVGATDSLFSTVGTYTLQYQPLHNSAGNAIPRHQFTQAQKPKDYKTGCSWPVVYTLSVPLTWKSGFYYVKCSLLSDSSVSRRFPFVVRQKNLGASKILYQVSMSEYFAYASWGGGSFYWWTDSSLDQPNPGANYYIDTVSFLRPLGNAIGSDATNDLGSFDDYERNFISWAEQAGYVMEYCANTDIDLDAVASPNPFSFISNYKYIIIGGHDEYCSFNERKGIEAQSLKPPSNVPSKNISFLSANMIYWMVNYADNRTRMQCHKLDDISLWRNQAVVNGVGGPEGKFIGVQYDQGYNFVNRIDTVRLSTHWLFNGTGLHDGNAFGYGTSQSNPGILSAEIDHTFPSSPPNIQVLSSAWVDSTIIGEDTTHHIHIYGPVLHESTFYVDTSSNARVFAGGSQRWSSGLWSYDAQDQSHFRTFTTNLMDHFNGKKYTGDIWTNPTWDGNTEVDGHVYLKSNKILTLSNNMALNIDSGYTLFVDGTLQINEPVSIAGSGIIKINSSGKLNIQTSVLAGWNMVSVPNVVNNFLRTTVYSGATTNAFAYQGSYVRKDTLKNGPGYWVKYGGVQAITYTGYTGSQKLDSLSIPVTAGWNMIGSISSPVATTKITTLDSAVVTSKYWHYDGTSYGTSGATSLEPGKAYWVRVVKSGHLILSVKSTATTTPSTSADLPPDPPTPPAQPEIFLPITNTIGVSTSPTFTWGGQSSTGPYHLQVSTSSSFATLTYDNASISSMSQTVGSLAYSTPYYWRVCEANAYGEGDWSEQWSFTTTSGIVLSWTPSNTHPQLTWTVPSGITYPYKVYNYYCECEAGDCGARQAFSRR